MVLFHFTLPKSGICTERELYFRDLSRSVEYQEESGRILMPQGARVSFDTYFNCFSYSRYQKYTNVHALRITLTLEGSFRIRLMARRVGYNEPELLSEQTIGHSAPGAAQIAQPLADLTGEGFLYAELLALSDNAVFSGGRYESADSTARPVKLAAVICSYHHEKYVYRNAAMLERYLLLPQNREFRDCVSLLIVDNGQTLERKKLECGRTMLFHNRNLGGSGGFARGLIEAAHSPEGFTHVCLMDDDVRFDPEVLYKTFAFLRALRGEYADLSIGGTMLELERPYYQYEMGGVWTGRSIVSRRSGFDMRNSAEVLANEAEVSADYNAWWYMCMPVSLIKKHGLPMPFFIKGDDMDFSLRAGGEVAPLNGVAVWHESFAGKLSGALEYYIKRNELILNALHLPEYGMFRELVKLLFSCGKQIIFQRYDVVDFITRAYEDFLKGADFFLETDGERLNRELMEKSIPMLDDEALAEKLGSEYPGVRFLPKPERTPNRFVQAVTLCSYLIPKSFYRKAQAYRALEMSDMTPMDFYGARCVLQYNSFAGRGLVTTLKKSEAPRFMVNFIRISAQMLLGYRKASKSYRERRAELTGMDFWLKQLRLDPERYQSNEGGKARV